MADDPTPTPPKPDVRAGGTLDLSTGKPAPPPPEPTPLPPAPADSDVRAGRTLNLSTGKAPSGGRRKPVAASLGPGPIIRETLDLSSKTPKPAPDEISAPPSAASASAAASTGGGPKGKAGPSKGTGGRRDDRSKGRSKRGEAPASASSSLADLLDPEVLAKLRGD